MEFINSEKGILFFNRIHRMKKLDLGLLVNGIHFPELMLLATISECQKKSPDGKVGVSDLVRMMEIPAPAVSRLLGIIERAGFVERKFDLEDRRKTLVTLTEDGRSILAKGDVAINEYLAAVFDRMGEDKMGQLAELFKEMLEISEDELVKRSKKKDVEFKLSEEDVEGK